VTIGTGVVELAGSDACEPDEWTFLALCGPIAIPNSIRCAGECITGRHNCGSD